MAKLGQPPKLILKPGDIVDDLKCIGIKHKQTKNANNATFYTMQCMKCGRQKDMLSSTIRMHKGTKHTACGKGLKLKDKIFYQRWQAMRTRTTNANQENHKWYKNINSDAFENFIDFYDAMYPSFEKASQTIPKDKISLERIDNTKDYTADNCKWIDIRDQQKHTSRIVTFKVTYPDGHKEIHHNIRQFAKDHNLNYSTICDCMNPNRSTKTHKGYQFKRIGKLCK